MGWAWQLRRCVKRCIAHVRALQLTFMCGSLNHSRGTFTRRATSCNAPTCAMQRLTQAYQLPSPTYTTSSRPYMEGVCPAARCNICTVSAYHHDCHNKRHKSTVCLSGADSHTLPEQPFCHYPSRRLFRVKAKQFALAA